MKISLLPAFGAFTGGYQVDRDQNCKIFVIGDNEYGQSAEVFKDIS